MRANIMRTCCRRIFRWLGRGVLTGFAALGCILVPSTHGAEGATPFVMPKSELIALPQTSANGRNYLLYVSFPLSYDTAGPNRRYPVIYLCDPYWDFPPVAYAADNVRRDGHAPETLVVGIGYPGTNPDVGLLRQWDLTPGIDPVYDSTGARTGHAEEFLTVIADEIIPFVEATYRADPNFRVLMGASFAGLFATYAAFQRPGLFQGIVASSPSLDWNKDYVLTRAQQHKASGASLHTRIYVGWAVGDETKVVASSKRFVQELHALSIPSLRLAAREIEGGAHSGTKIESFTRGLRYAFAPQAWVPVVGSDPGYGSLGRFINLSTRGRVDSGENALIGGIVVHGVLPKRVLVRAAGPALGDFGVAQPLANPRLRVVNASNVTVAENDDWGTNTDLAAINTAVTQTGAFPFAAGSLDAATIVRLAPGQYTVVVESADGTAGIALVEAYELGP
jgi:uncharacterized protein